MILLLDENMPPGVAKALHPLGTQDAKIRRRPQEVVALRQARVGAFMLTGSANRSVEGMLSFLVLLLDEMRRLAKSTTRPFIYGISDRKKFERLD